MRYLRMTLPGICAAALEARMEAWKHADQRAVTSGLVPKAVT
jgi:hypothetical protein